MRRRAFLAALGGATVSRPFAAHAQRPPMAVIGFLDAGPPTHFGDFRQGMRDLGYIEGDNISYVYRAAEGRADPIPQLALELVRSNPGVIVTASALPNLAVKQPTSTIPIVVVVAHAGTGG